MLKNTFTKLKSIIPKDKRSNIVYQIPCKDCDKIYIGQTGQYLKNRINGHKYDKKNKTALTNHEIECQHTFNFNDTKILATENHTRKREFLEMIYIQKNNNTINAKSDTQNLSKIYYNLIN